MRWGRTVAGNTPGMSPSRIAGVAAAVALLLTAGCAGEEEPSATGTSATATAAPTTSDAVVAWAGEVCSGADAVRAAVLDFAAAVPVDLGGGQPPSDQVRAGIRAGVDAVKQEVASLTTAVQALPPEADAGVAEAKEGLSTAAAQAQRAVDGLATAAQQVAAATTPEAVEAALPELRSAMLSAGTAVTAFASDVRVAMSSTNETVRSSFAAAPSCQQIPTT